VVNNAVFAQAARIQGTPLELSRQLCEVNFLGTIQVTRAARSASTSGDASGNRE